MLLVWWQLLPPDLFSSSSEKIEQLEKIKNHMPFRHYRYKNMAKFMVEYIKGLFLFTPYNVKMVRFEVKVKMGLTGFEPMTTWL